MESGTRGLALFLFLAASTRLDAQHEHADTTSRNVMLSATATVVATRVDPALFGQPLTEGYLTQPMLMAHGSWLSDRLTGRVTLNFEGATLKRGELGPGIYGEGYIDRRHPHTSVHEAMMTWQGGLRRHAVSLSAGKGFVPFGSDDPMSRPFVKFPVNHHLAQLLERAMVAGGVRRRGLLVEAALFNGDEPEGPADWPNLSRFGDSWAARVTLMPRRSLEISGSVAAVESPEDAGGQGLDQHKQHVGVRWGSPGRTGGLTYTLLEYARTTESRGARTAWTFDSFLAEAMAVARGVDVAARVERATRPDEERIANRFRSYRPLLDFNILGRSRWTTLTVNIAHPVTLGREGKGRVTPFVEMARSFVTATTSPAAFEPAAFYGSPRLSTVSVGVHIAAGAGSVHERMGRYGVADPEHR